MPNQPVQPRPVVLIVGPEEAASGSLFGFLRANALEVAWARDDGAAHRQLDHRRVDCLITELRAPHVDGFLLLRHGLARNPDLCAVVVAGPDQVPLALEAMREGPMTFSSARFISRSCSRSWIAGCATSGWRRACT